MRIYIFAREQTIFIYTRSACARKKYPARIYYKFIFTYLNLFIFCLLKYSNKHQRINNKKMLYNSTSPTNKIQYDLQYII